MIDDDLIRRKALLCSQRVLRIRGIFFFIFSRINRLGNIYTTTLDRYWDSFFLLLIRKVGNCRKHLFLEINLNGSRFFSL